MIPAFPAVNAHEAQMFLRAEYAAAEPTDYWSVSDLALVQQISAAGTRAARYFRFALYHSTARDSTAIPHNSKARIVRPVCPIVFRLPAPDSTLCQTD